MTQIGNRGTNGVSVGRVSAALALSLVAGIAPCAAQSLSGMAAENNPAPTQRGAATEPGTGQPAADAQSSDARQLATKGDGKVNVDDNLIVEMHVKDEDLGNVLAMLSMQSQRNIIASQSVSASVTANLYGVTFYEALDSILHANGFGYVENGNFIYVYTLEEIQEIEAATRMRIGKVIKLNYLNAIDAAEFVKPLLSDGGQIKSNGRAEKFNLPENAPTGNEDYASESALVIYDYEENVAEIEKLIQALDTRPAQILIEATILQTQLNEANAFGVDFAVLGDLNFSDFVTLGGPLKAVEGLFGGQGGALIGGSEVRVPIPGADGEGRAISSNVGNQSGPATFRGGIVDGDVAAFIRMLDEVTDTNIISKPKLLTLNRQPARVLVGRKVGYLSTTATDTSTTQTVEFLDTGTQLYVRPFVTNEGSIRMELKPQVSEAIIRDVTDATGAAVTIPDEVTNELVANVMVRDGQTIVLGGLFRESTKATRRQVPVVGDIPIIGAAFRGHDDNVDRSEIIFLITPSIVSDAILSEQGAKGESYVEAVRAGSREGLLPFSRERQSQSLRVQAEKAFAEGNTSKGDHLLRRSMRLNRNQPDAYLMRETQSPSRVKEWKSGSMLDEIIGQEARDAARARGAMAPADGSTPSDGIGDSNPLDTETTESVTTDTSTESTETVSFETLPTSTESEVPSDASTTADAALDPSNSGQQFDQGLRNPDSTSDGIDPSATDADLWWDGQDQTGSSPESSDGSTAFFTDPTQGYTPIATEQAALVDVPSMDIFAADSTIVAPTFQFSPETFSQIRLMPGPSLASILHAFWREQIRIEGQLTAGVDTTTDDTTK